jgi:hypothetical protein
MLKFTTLLLMKVKANPWLRIPFNLTTTNPVIMVTMIRLKGKTRLRTKLLGFAPANINWCCPPKMKYDGILSASRSTHFVHTITSQGITPD